MRLILDNASIVNPDAVEENRSIIVDNGKIESIEDFRTASRKPRGTVLDAADWLVFPGLINVHDHLRGSWRPRCGKGPYKNSYEWLRELHAKPSKFAPARERERIALDDLYLLGAYKNLFSGVTTVVDHYTRLDPETYSELPIRLITEFGREGVVRTYDDPDTFPSWGDGILEEYKRFNGIRPFMIHVEEGFDPRTRTELRRLDELGVLGPNTVLIHGIGFDETDMQIVRKRGCHMVWCPATHEFLYGRTANVQRWLELGINTCLGTDSSLTGSINLFEEFRTARKVYREHFQAEIEPVDLLRMVTVNPARALMIQDRVGRIAPGLSADLLVLMKQDGQDPLETLIDALPEDIVLLLQAGRPMYGDRGIAEHFDSLEGCPAHEKITIGRKPKCIVGNLSGLLERVYEQIGRRFKPEFIPIDDSSALSE